MHLTLRIVFCIGCFFLVGHVRAIAVDDVNGFVYWGETNSQFGSTRNAIKRATLKGDDITIIVDGGKLYNNNSGRNRPLSRNRHCNPERVWRL